MARPGVLSGRPVTRTNDFFADLLKTSTSMRWEAASDGVFAARNRAIGEKQWAGPRVELIFGSNSQLRELAEDGMRARVCRCVCGGMEQGDAPRSVRPRLISAGGFPGGQRRGPAPRPEHDQNCRNTPLIRRGAWLRRLTLRSLVSNAVPSVQPLLRSHRLNDRRAPCRPFPSPVSRSAMNHIALPGLSEIFTPLLMRSHRPYGKCIEIIWDADLGTNS